MNLYRISQNLNCDYDTYDSAVVASESQDKAKLIHPRGNGTIHTLNIPAIDWVNDENLVCVEYIGKATDGIAEGDVICASFNAG